MLLHVYRLRHLGKRCPPDFIVRDAVRGDVRVEGFAGGWTGRRHLVAHTFADDQITELVPSLRDVAMRVRLALVIKGMEQVPRGRKDVDLFPQTWVCSLRPIPVERWPALPPLRRAPSATGFDEADDDA